MEVRAKDSVVSTDIKELDGVILEYSEGFFRVVRNKTDFYLINAETKEEFGPLKDCSRYSEDVCAVNVYDDSGESSFWTFVDKKFKMLPICLSDKPGDFKCGFSKIGDKKFMDKNFSIHTCTWSLVVSISEFSEGFAIAENILGKKFYIGTNFKQLSRDFNKAFPFENGKATVELKGREYKIDKVGNEYPVVELPMEDDGVHISELIENYNIEELAVMTLTNLDNVIIPPEEAKEIYFTEGLAPIMYKDRLIYIDKKGKQVISLPTDYVCAENFIKDYAIIRDNVFVTSCDLLDKKGNIIPFKDSLFLTEDYLVIGKNKYIKTDAIKDIKISYDVISKNKDEEIVQSFKTESERVCYLELIKKEFGLMEIKMDEYADSLGNELFEDIKSEKLLKSLKEKK